MLEEKIERLTDAVEALTRAIQSGDNGPGPSYPDTEEAAPSSDNVTPIGGAVTREGVRQLCLQVVRKDKAHKPKVKAAIRAAGGEMVDDVPDEKLGELKAAIEALQ